MSFQIKTVRKLTEWLAGMEDLPAEWDRLEPILEIIELLKDTGSNSPDLVLTEYLRKTGHNDEKCWEVRRRDEPSFIKWSIRWYFDRTDEGVIVVFDIYDVTDSTTG